MSGALNIFKTVLANATTDGDTVYTAALGYSTVVLLAQISNIDTANTVGVSAQVTRTDINTGNVITQNVLVLNTQIPVGDAISILTGRLILNFGDSLEIQATANASAQLTLSLLETLTG
jgi:hypothetical protein